MSGVRRESGSSAATAVVVLLEQQQPEAKRDTLRTLFRNGGTEVAPKLLFAEFLARQDRSLEIGSDCGVGCTEEVEPLQPFHSTYLL